MAGRRQERAVAFSVLGNERLHRQLQSSGSFPKQRAAPTSSQCNRLNHKLYHVAERFSSLAPLYYCDHQNNFFIWDVEDILTSSANSTIRRLTPLIVFVFIKQLRKGRG
jgi:hypothetical protein